MGRNQNWSLLRSLLKTAVKKLNFVARFVRESKWRKRRLASICGSVISTRQRSWTFNDRYIGLQQCVEDQDQDQSSGGKSSSSSSVRALQRTSSSVYYSFSDHNGDVDDDIDERAEIFISNFRRRLLYERQVSLQLPYGERY